MCCKKLPLLPETIDSASVKVQEVLDYIMTASENEKGPTEVLEKEPLPQVSPSLVPSERPANAATETPARKRVSLTRKVFKQGVC